MEAETAHRAALGLLRVYQLLRPLRRQIERRLAVSDPRLLQELWGVRFSNPVGLAAGFDKDGLVAPAMASLGFGFLELGTVTPRPQPGNPRPRVFRVSREASLVNALGFNNHGAEALAARMDRLGAVRVPVGVNLGKNRDTPNERALEDYRLLGERFGERATYLVLNVSSPNTPGLRELQNEGFVREVVAAVRGVARCPVLLKLTPDENPGEAARLARAAVASGAAGIVATNTTDDPVLLERLGQRRGGVSGRLLQTKSRATLSAIVAELGGEVPIVSVGGVDSGEEAYARLRAGASLVQLYTALTFEGPSLVSRINRRLLELLERDGLEGVGQASRHVIASSQPSTGLAE